MRRKIIIGSRKSRLALAQARIVLDCLTKAHPKAKFEIQTITTSGDQVETVQVLRSMGKGVFVKEIETALLRRKIDLAVHSLKDMPTTLPEGLKFAAVTEREDPADVFISANGLSLRGLPADSRVGTSSLRRRAFLSRNYPRLRIEDLRGNVDSRIAKLRDKNNGLSGIVLAAAGLRRLFPTKMELHMERIPIELLPPAPGQGILAIETRTRNPELEELIAVINHEPTFACAIAERSILHRLQGGCNVPISALAEIQDGLLKLTCWISSLDGSRVITQSCLGTPEEAEQIALSVEIMLKGEGATDLIEEIRMQIPWARSEEGDDVSKPKKARNRRP